MKVIQDLGLPAVVPGPGRVLGEGEAVEVAGDVAGTAGVGVLPPRPPQLGGLLQDGEPQLSHLQSAVTLVFSPHTQTRQLPADTEPRDPGSDNNNMEVRRGPDLGWLSDLQVEQSGEYQECQAGPTSPQLPN